MLRLTFILVLSVLAIGAANRTDSRRSLRRDLELSKYKNQQRMEEGTDSYQEKLQKRKEQLKSQKNVKDLPTRN